ncbi:MAG: c-type cytochrome, partial [Acidobacteriota bacterium]
DHLVMPRIAFPLGDGVILALETDNRDLYQYTDTDGDGVADKKELFYAGVGRVQNMEWQPGGMTWALDNWLYTTYNPFRLRLAPGGRVLREETEPNGGQWWSAQDNYGKTWWVDGGGEIGPVNIQAPIAYGAFNVPDNFEPDFQVPWPAPGGIADMQGGMRRVRLPEGTLNHFTAAAGVEIYRGDRLPDDFVGDLLFNEPVARIVRRAKVVVRDGLTQLQNAYPQSEFVRSTDPLFRPVSITNGPDGTLYLSDMYTGIIQDAQFVGPNSYLRRKVDQYQLDKQHNWGRVWRITHDSRPPDFTPPRMYQETAAQLVAHLEHPNGWWRDTAQKLLVLRQDASVAPALQTMARSSTNQLGRIHALWTLEGLGALDARLVRELMKAADPQIRIQAMRASETLYKAGDQSFAADYRALAEDAVPDVVIQALLTMSLQKVPDAAAVVRTTAERSASRGVREIGAQILKPGAALGQRPSLADPSAGAMNLSANERKSMIRGEGTYKELCVSCHGPDGKGAPMAGGGDGATLAPPLAGSPRVQGHRDYAIKVLMNGLSGPVAGKSYAGGVMVSMGTNTDEWLADAASYIRNSFGHAAGSVSTTQVAAVRKTTVRKTPWTLAELLPMVPAPLTNQADWKLTASHNPAAAANATATVPGARWDSGAPQQPGMWLQIELPQTVSVAEVDVSTVASTPGARGRGGRGAGPATVGPVGYSLQFSMDGATWLPPAATGTGLTPTTVIEVPRVSARFIRITQTGTAVNGEFWGVQQVRILTVE